MKATKVIYQVQPEFVETNKTNIKRVTEALKGRDSNDIKYNCYYMGEGKFMHMTVTRGDRMAILNELPEFKVFLDELNNSKPIIPAQTYALEFVGSNIDID